MSSVRGRRGVSALLSIVLAAAGLLVAAPRASADSIRDDLWYLGPLGVSHAWTLTKGAKVKIGIVDSGVDGTVADLRGAVTGGKDFSGQGAANGQQPVGGDGHGTAVAAFAAGRGHGSGAGVIGTAPAADIVSASISFSAGAAQSAEGAAVRWLADQGVGVINMSFAVFNGGSALADAVRYAESKDVVLVAATGDMVKGEFVPGPPATIPGVIGVTGIDQNLKRDEGATIGKGTAIAAPFSTLPTTEATHFAVTKGLPVVRQSDYPGGPYGDNVGTSFSAPIVAGIVALIRAKHPDLNAANVVNRLLKTATPAGGSTPNTTYGYGIVNADKALSANVAPVSANPLGSLVPGGSSTAPTSGPSSAQSSSASVPPTDASSPPVPAPSSPPAGASSDSSSGLGTGAWIAIAAVVVLAALLIGWLVSRGRRRDAGGPPGYGPPR